MSKLIYISMVCFDDENTINEGITKKIKGQILSLTNYGIETDFVGRKKGKVCLWRSGETKELFVSTGSGYKDFNRLAKVLIPMIESRIWDKVYVRYSGTGKNMLDLYRLCKKMKIEILLEVPTYPYKQEWMRSIKGMINYAISDYFNKYLKKYVTSVVTFGKIKTIWGIPAISIKNGIDMTNIPITQPNYVKNIRLVLLGNLIWWQGYDRLLEGLALYYQTTDIRRKVYVEIVGDGAELDNYRRIIKSNNLHDYVTFHGRKGGTDLDKVFSDVHVGVNSLGCHRKGLTELSTLKSKEFLARGLPVIYSTKDNSLPEDLFFCKKIPEDESPVDIIEIISFYDEVIEYKGYSEKIRNFAERTISWDIQIKEILKNF